MREFLLRIIKTGVPAALVLGGFGYVLAEYAGNMVASQSVPRQNVLEDGSGSAPIAAGDQLAHQLRGKLPFTMAAWGLGIVFILELLRAVWVPPPPETKESEPMPQTVDELLNQLAARVEAESRKPVDQP